MTFLMTALTGRGHGLLTVRAVRGVATAELGNASPINSEPM